MDGYGFHEGFFSRHRYVDEQIVPAHLSSYARRIFDQGLGRSIWFSAGADVERIAAMIAAFPQARQADLWIGIGVACGYVGGVDRATIEALRERQAHIDPKWRWARHLWRRGESELATRCLILTWRAGSYGVSPARERPTSLMSPLKCPPMVQNQPMRSCSSDFWLNLLSGQDLLQHKEVI